MGALFVCLAVVVGASDAAPAVTGSYLLRVATAVDRANAEYKNFEASAAEAAPRLIAGSKLWAAGDAAFASELSGRAGGLMLMAPLGDAVPAKDDVVLYSLAGGVPIPDALRQSGAYIVAFGDGPADGAAAHFSGHATECDISPTLASIIPAWIYCGALIGACMDRDKMPVTYETIGLPGGYPRIQQYQAKGIYWVDLKRSESEMHSNLGAAFAQDVIRILKRVDEEEREALSRAGSWAAKTLADGKTVYMYAMGHFVPDELARTDIGKKFKVATWNSGFGSAGVPQDVFTSGDLGIHVGYQHPPNGLFERARPAGANIVYVDVLEHRDWKNDPHVLWIDPMWPWDDAVVSVQGYDIPMLPPSGIVNCAIAWEIYRLTTTPSQP